MNSNGIIFRTDKRDRRGERDAEHRTNPKNHDRIRDHRGM